MQLIKIGLCFDCNVLENAVHPAVFEEREESVDSTNVFNGLLTPTAIIPKTSACPFRNQHARLSILFGISPAFCRDTEGR